MVFLSGINGVNRFAFVFRLFLFFYLLAVIELQPEKILLRICRSDLKDKMLIYVNAIGRMEAVQCHQIAGANVNIILGFMTLSFDFFDFLIKELCMENNGESDRLIQFHQKGNRVPENGI